MPDDNRIKGSVIEQVSRQLCVGCGACAAVCPSNRISVKMDAEGCYKASYRDGSCEVSCGLCTSVCPSSSSVANEDDIGQSLYAGQPSVSHDINLGYYLSCWAGSSASGTQRIDGASGGIATWLLTEMLEKGLVDSVACVSACHSPGPLFRYALRDSVEEVQSCARSAYYPVEMSEILSTILAEDKRYAVVCLPCFAKALRLASRAIPRLAERIVCIIGLTCGHSVSSYFSEYVGALANESAGMPDQIIFRTKDPRFSATEFGTECVWGASDNVVKKTVFWSDGLAEAWSEHWFTPSACMYCDDVFAETADVAVMDAWLDEYAPDYRGNNLVVVRSGLVVDLIDEGIKCSKLSLGPCSVDKVIESQALVIDFKRTQLAYRLSTAAKDIGVVPVKRVKAASSDNWYMRALCRTKVNASSAGLRLWPKRTGLSDFIGKMHKTTDVEKSIRRERWFGLPGRIASRLMGRKCS